MVADAHRLSELLREAAADRRPEAEAALALLVDAPLAMLTAPARELTERGFGNVVTYSRKVFIPLTQLCRDVCHYCTFAKAPRRLQSPYLSIEQVLAIARAGEIAGCKEALFTLGDQPEQRYGAARRALDELGCATTLDYLKLAAGRVLAETALLPHLNPGLMSAQDCAALRPVAASMGLMLETAAERLSRRGGPHFGSPDKLPELRLATLRAAGAAHIAMTSGLLIGIGETRRERIEALLALRDLQDTYGHVQEIIIQNFRAKPGTKMARAPEPALEEQLWTIAVARILFGPSMSIQAPPNLQPEALAQLIEAGINDWGGVSPVTPDHVNPEAPWPQLQELERRTAAAGRALIERLALGPAYARDPARWTDAALTPRVWRMSDANGWARTDRWFAGSGAPLPAGVRVPGASRGAAVALAGEVAGILARAQAGEELSEAAICRLFAAQGREFDLVLASADRLRAATVGEAVTYVVNRNINYTNICSYRCGFCAFSKGRSAASLRGPAYNLDLEEIAQRTIEAHAAGATEVCLQGGIHPSFTGETYLAIAAAVRAAVPSMHVHAFSPLEVMHGARTLGLPLEDYLLRLKEAGLATLPGTAAEILDDEIRAQICPDKLRTDEWLAVIESAHRIGLRTTATILFGHLEQPVHWARHLLRVRRLQARTGGITELVPLAYVHMEAPLWRKGRTRSGPTFREALLMHAVGRIALHPLVPNIQASWVKLGVDGVALALQAGANDLGGTLMDESITRSAGGVHGQELDAEQLTELAACIGRPARQRTTLYGVVAAPVVEPAVHGAAGDARGAAVR
ncbi:MAG: 5-amino-6-(D-ribitylamino)uracil--L-tyrosine 4-hydroxyphenyl transferase CofH [Gammaproteobacteria bacterium]|nr:5-amino-6-(D-ribitylamino)uracil--L-tyrosine 4-hydroxyphenyl transferase CofH [Gammaproteobacteria bacterium]